MSLGYCEDCGCRTVDGVCSNCQEELFIFDNQIAGETEEPFSTISKEFRAKVDEQRKFLKERNEANNI